MGARGRKTNLRGHICAGFQTELHLPSLLYYSKKGFAAALPTFSVNQKVHICPCSCKTCDHYLTKYLQISSRIRQSQIVPAVASAGPDVVLSGVQRDFVLFYTAQWFCLSALWSCIRNFRRRHTQYHFTPLAFSVWLGFLTNYDF